VERIDWWERIAERVLGRYFYTHGNVLSGNICRLLLLAVLFILGDNGKGWGMD
jgi:hypothetical protein